MKASGGKNPNRLVHSASPYLMQHAYNPVDWYPWGEEAFRLARAMNRPIFLSIGYAACHWCHVMERQVFEKESVAQALSRDFVSIKVDREERPDVDARYMLAAQLLSGVGGWPLSAFLTPNLDPIFAVGSYFPEAQFLELLAKVAAAWHSNRDALAQQAAEVAHAIGSRVRGGAACLIPSDTVELAVSQLRARFDSVHGGFGTRAKFPMVGVLRFLCQAAPSNADAHRMLHTTARRIARGGIHDHVGGGFFRYATDRQWRIPHFEKMLYDQAQLLSVFAEAYCSRPDADYRASATGIVHFVLRELRHHEGGFFSSLDADSEGEEGKYYLFTAREVRDALGNDAHAFSAAYGVREEGNFENGKSVLSLERDSLGVGEMQSELARLLEVRSQRSRPATDDKVVAAWNAMMVEGLCKAAEVFGMDEALQAAEEAAAFAMAHMIRGETIIRTWRDGMAGGAATLADYACWMLALVTLWGSTGKGKYLAVCEELAQGMVKRFRDAESGGFFDFDPSLEGVIPFKTAEDNAEPSANGVAALALVGLAQAAGSRKWQELADNTLRAFGSELRTHPGFAATLLRACLASTPPVQKVELAGPEEVRMEAGRAVASISLRLPEGWRVYAPDESSPSGSLGVRVGGLPTEWQSEIRLPDAEVGEGGTRYYSGLVTLELVVQAPKTAEPGNYPVEVSVYYQACTASLCVPPETHTRIVLLSIPEDWES